MEKLLELLGKIIEAVLSLFTLETIRFIAIVAAIFTLALLFLPDSILTQFGVLTFRNNNQQWIGLVALASIALILAQVAIWVLGLIKDQFFV
jgi:hypothetical protein